MPSKQSTPTHRLILRLVRASSDSSLPYSARLFALESIFFFLECVKEDLPDS